MRENKLYTLGLYEKAMPSDLSWKEKLTAAKEAGYDFVEMSIDASEEKISRVYMKKEERLEIIKTMYDVGLPIKTMNVSALTKYSLGDENKEICQRGIHILEHAIELADDLGIHIIMVPGYDIYYGESTYSTQQRFIKNLKYGVELAAKHSILLELETMENDFMNTVWKAMYYVNMIKSPYLGIYPDSGNIKNAASLLGLEETQDIMNGAGHITAVHLKETKLGQYRDLMYGEGYVDFQKVISAAWKIGVRKYVTEFWYQGNKNWKDDLERACSIMTKILDVQ